MVPAREVIALGKRMVLAVTADLSLALMDGFPEALVERGWEVHLVASPGPRLSTYKEIRGVVVHELPMRREPSVPADLGALVRWVALLLRIRPDVLCAGTPKASLLGLIAAVIARVPARQYLVHGLRLETATGLLRRVLYTTERICVLASTDVVAVSASLKRRMGELGLTGYRKVTVLGSGSFNGVDLKRYDPNSFTDADRRHVRSELEIASEVPVVGYVGRLVEDKGIPELVSALLTLHESGTTAQLLAVGTFEDDVAKWWIDHARAAGIAVCTPGWTSNPAPFLAVMDVFCTPSRREGFGLAAIEASAMGVPVVATTATGLVDAVDDGATGLLSEVGDVAALARHLGLLLKEASIRERLGTTGRVYATAFERGRVQNLYIERFEEIRRART